MNVLVLKNKAFRGLFCLVVLIGSFSAAAARPRPVETMRTDRPTGKVYIDGAPEISVSKFGLPATTLGGFRGGTRNSTKTWWILALVFAGLGVIILMLLVSNLRRRSVEKALRESEQRWRLQYEGLPGYRFIVNEQRKIEDVNEALCTMTGFRRKELIGADCGKLCSNPGGECPIFNGERDRIDNYEGTIKTKDGRLIPILGSIRKIPFAGRFRIIENFHDLTRQKGAEKDLLHSEETERKFREMLTSLHEINVKLTTAESLDDLCREAVLLGHERLEFERLGIWFIAESQDHIVGSYGIDTNGNIRDERRMRRDIRDDDFCNQAMGGAGATTFCQIRDLIGDSDESLGQGPVALSTLWDGHKVLGFIFVDTLFSRSEISTTQLRVLSLFASSIGHLCVRLAAEKERILLAEAVEQASEAFVIADADGRIQYINQGLRNIFGDVDDDIIGRDIGILYGDANDPASLKKMAQAMQSGSVQTDRLIVQPKKGKPINVEVTLFPIRDVYEKIINFVLILHDITREEYLEEQLRQAAKMQAVGRLAGGVAHDFNNQLTVIKGYCNLLLRDLQQDDPTWECVDQIDRAATQASSLTNELLTFSRKQILKPQVVSPNNVLQGMEKSLAMLGEDIRLIIRTAKDVGNVLVDPNRLEQAIMNLAINARDAMPDGGELIIETSNVNIDDTYTTSQRLVKPGPHVMLSITDTGVGMDRQTIEKIFEPFFTTKEKGEGTGLGLALVYGFVDQSDGHVDVTSKPNKGTCFRMFLPLVEADTNAGESIGSTCPVEKGSETVLVVEDDDAVRKLIVRVLTENGYTILETGDSTKAEGLVAELGRPIDLLVSDVVMPILNGPALTETLRIKQPDLKVLFVSGYTGQTTLKHGVNSNEIHFLHKPFTPDSLCRAVTRAISEQNHTPPDKQE